MKQEKFSDWLKILGDGFFLLVGDVAVFCGFVLLGVLVAVSCASFCLVCWAGICFAELGWALFCWAGLCFAGPGVARFGLAWLGLAWRGSAWLLTWLCLALLCFASPSGLALPGLPLR